MAAEVKPDFSGEYVLNPHASTLGAGADAVRSAVLRIEHREPMVRCQATFAFDSKTFEYSLERVSDGREVIDQKEPTTLSSLHWEGNALVFMDRTKGPDSEVSRRWARPARCAVVIASNRPPRDDEHTHLVPATPARAR